MNAASIQTVTDETPITGSVPQVDAASIQHVTNEQPIDQISDNNVNMTPRESQSTEVETNENPSNPPGTISAKSFYVKHEKPKLPTFYGDVRKYFIFKSDFQHAIESHCSERDAITVLRSCLGPEPGKLIEGITTDLKAAWKYLDHNYGDPRVILDAITADLEKFKPLQSGDDHRFCEFVNLVRKSFNILNEVKRPQDMDNTHIISLIERKMTPDDLKVWSRHIYVQKKEPSLMNLLKWMEEEMTVRLRSVATIRKGSGSYRVKSVGSGRDDRLSPSPSKASGTHPASEGPKKQCYVCKETHYVDQCPRFKAMTPKERWEIVKEQKACFSCLKQSKGHTVSNCMRKRECQEKNSDGSVCKKLHHKLLHDNTSSNQKNVVGFIQDNSEAILPVISANVKSPDDKCKRASVFYDSGAQVSIIRDAFAEEMGLESKPITILIAKVGETEEEINTKLYKVPNTNSRNKWTSNSNN